MNKAVLLAGAVSLALTFGPPALAQSAGTVKVGLDVDASTLDPRLARDTSAFRVDDLIFDGLVRLNGNLQPQPGLALSWENPNPTTWIFHLRDGVKFSDGTPFTADDVVYTYQSILDPKMNAPNVALVKPIKTIEATDPKTVKITLSAPYAPLLSYLDFGIVSKKDATAAGADMALHPVGTGPMTLESWDRGSKIVLDANSAYWGGKPKIDKMELDIVGDNTARAQALEAGDLDLIQSPLSPQDIQRLQGESKFKNGIIAGLGFTYLNINVSDPILSDPKVRTAVGMLVDQQSIVGQIYAGVDKIATSILLPSYAAYSPDIKQPGFDADGAAKLLDSDGWTAGSDGIRVKDGKKLTLTLSTHSEDPNRVQSVEFLQEQMKQAGIDAQVQISDWPSFFGNVAAGKYQVALLGWLNLTDPDHAMYGELHSGQGLNWGKYSNPTVDADLDKGRQAQTLADRNAAYQDAAKQIAADLPYYIISYQGYQVFYNPRIGAVDVDPRGYLRSIVLNN